MLPPYHQGVKNPDPHLSIQSATCTVMIKGAAHGRIVALATVSHVTTTPIRVRIKMTLNL